MGLLTSRLSPQIKTCNKYIPFRNDKQVLRMQLRLRLSLYRCNKLSVEVFFIILWTTLIKDNPSLLYIYSYISSVSKTDSLKKLTASN